MVRGIVAPVSIVSEPRTPAGFGRGKVSNECAILRAAFKQYFAERWLLNGKLQPGYSGLEDLEAELIELMDDGGDDDNEEDGDREDADADADADEVSNKLLQLQADAGPFSLCSLSLRVVS